MESSSYDDGGLSDALPITIDDDAASISSVDLCIDADGDGFGRHCTAGTDCNDRDPSVHQDCGIRTVGTGQACDAPAGALFDCFSWPEASEGEGSLCRAGKRACLGGRWTECAYASSFSISTRRLLPRTPDECSPCNPLCAGADEHPDLVGADESDDYHDVQYDAPNQWIRLRPTRTSTLADEDMDGVPDDWDFDPHCAERDGFDDGPDFDGDHYPDRPGCDEDPNDPLRPATGTPLPAGCGDADYALSLLPAHCRTDALGMNGSREIFHLLPEYGLPVGDGAHVRVQNKHVDVYIVLDNTGSMREENLALRAALPSIVEQIRRPENLPNAWFGLGAFQDFPDAEPDASPAFNFGYTYKPSSMLPSDRPYQHIQDMTDDVDVLTNAVNMPAIPDCNCPTGEGLETCSGSGGQSSAEAVPSALQSAITGNAIARGAHVDVPSRLDSAEPACPAERYGYPCFREGAWPIFLVITDSPMHNGPNVVNVGCCDANCSQAEIDAQTCGNCMGVHPGFSQAGATAGLARSTSCAYPAAMGVSETFETLVSAMTPREARIATVWSGDCQAACRDECRAGTRNLCDSCSYGTRVTATCTTPQNTPRPALLATQAQCDSLSGFLAGSTCGAPASACDVRLPMINSATAQNYGSASPLRTGTVLEGYRGTAWAGAGSIPGGAAPFANTGPSPGGIGAWSSSCLAGNAPAISCNTAGACTRYCSGAMTYRGRAECPVSNPVWTAGGVRPSPFSALASDTGAFRHFWSYDGSAVSCPNGSQWLPPFDRQPTGSPGYNVVTRFCPGTMCPAAGGGSTDVQNGTLPAACVAARPAATQNVYSFYTGGTATPPVPSCSAWGYGGSSNPPYTLGACTPNQPYQSYGTARAGTIVSGGLPASTTSASATATFSNSTLGVCVIGSNAVGTCSASGACATGTCASGSTGVCNAPASGTASTGPALLPSTNNCCVPGQPRRVVTSSTTAVPIRFRPDAMCPSGTTSSAIETITIPTGVGCLSGDCVIGGVGESCRCDPSSNSCRDCTYQRKTCVETCATPPSVERTTCTCNRPADVSCDYQERRASCAPLCGENRSNTCWVQQPDNSTPIASAPVGACTPTMPVPPTVDPSATCTYTTDVCNGPTSGPAPSLCNAPNDLYTPGMLQPRQTGGANALCDVNAVGAYNDCAPGSSVPAPRRVPVPGCTSVPCDTAISREMVGCRNATSGAMNWRRACAPDEMLCSNIAGTSTICRPRTRRECLPASSTCGSPICTDIAQTCSEFNERLLCCTSSGVCTPRTGATCNPGETAANGCYQNELLNCCAADGVCTWRSSTCNPNETVNNDPFYNAIAHPNLTSSCNATQFNSCRMIPRADKATSTTSPAYYCQNYWDGTCICPNGAAGSIRTSGMTRTCSACPSALASQVEWRDFECAQGSYESEAEQWRQLARRTDSMQPDGVTPVFEGINSNGSGLGLKVVEAVTQLANYKRQDIRVMPLQVNDYLATFGSLPPGSEHFIDDRNDPMRLGPEIDETLFLFNVLTNASDPNVVPDNCIGHNGQPFTDGRSYFHCKPGTKSPFTFIFRNQTNSGGITRPIVAADPLRPKTYYFFIEIYGETRPSGVHTTLQIIPVTIVVPPSGAEYVDHGWYERDFDFSTYCASAGPTYRPHVRRMEWQTGWFDAPAGSPPTPLGMPPGTRIEWSFYARRTLSQLQAITDTTPPDLVLDVRADGTGVLPTVTSHGPLVPDFSIEDLSEQFFAAGRSDSNSFLRVRATLYSNEDEPAHSRSPTLSRFEPFIECRVDE